MSLRDAGERRHARRSHSFVVRGNEDRTTVKLLSTKRRQVVANLMRRRTLVAETNRAVGPREHRSLARRSRSRHYRETRHCDVAALFAARVIEHPPDRRRRMEVGIATFSAQISAPGAPAGSGSGGRTGRRRVMAASSNPARSKTTTKTVTPCRWKSCTTRPASASGTRKPRPRISQPRCTGQSTSSPPRPSANSNAVRVGHAPRSICTRRSNRSRKRQTETAKRGGQSGRARWKPSRYSANADRTSVAVSPYRSRS